MKKDKSIFIKNIYYMLAYAFSVLKESVYEDVGKESFANIYNLFAAILSKGIGLELKRGLYLEYINRVEDIPLVRGKIDIEGTLRKRLECHMLVTSDYDELSENNILNQILKSTVFLLFREKDVDEQYKAELKKEMLYFSKVDIIDLFSVRWTSLRFPRNNRNYQLLLLICQFLFEGVLFREKSGNYHLASFVDEQRMSRLYEKFILEYYAQEFGKRIRGFSSKARQVAWQVDDGYDALLPVMQTDITLTYGKNTLIIDTKYYQRIFETNFAVQKLHSANMYQIFTYVKNKDAELKRKGYQTSGMLLYAKTDEDLVLESVYQMSGNKISVRTLDLNQDFSLIASELNKIVEEHFGISI